MLIDVKSTTQRPDGSGMLMLLFTHGNKIMKVIANVTECIYGEDGPNGFRTLVFAEPANGQVSRWLDDTACSSDPKAP